jgi:hypothetical protein
MHGMISFGALAGGMIATSGDEAFVMLSLFPKTAIFMFGILFVVGIITGYIADKIPFIVSPDEHKPRCSIYDDSLAGCECRILSLKEIILEFKNISLVRFLLVSITLAFMYFLLIGHIGPEEKWMRITFVFILMASLFIISTVPEKYLEEHIWKHILKEHVWKIFLWTFFSLLILDIGLNIFNIESIVQNNILPVLIAGALIGIIPESGPHMIFVMMFSKGMIPFSVLLASSIAQDGHGMIPLLSCSVRTAVKVKVVNVIVGLIVGLLLYYAGF